ncbi:hypothetical protein [Streptomyces sp. NBC_00076]|uniref:hypothetical protein n=1 Tax=Streptomyces sp. NBC_00076 TaxID=2975642 RepID=UPI0032467E80
MRHAKKAATNLIQSDWMAPEKVKRWWPAIVHGTTYGLPFLLITQSPLALAVIVATRVVTVDRLGLRSGIAVVDQITP